MNMRQTVTVKYQNVNLKFSLTILRISHSTLPGTPSCTCTVSIFHPTPLPAQRLSALPLPHLLTAPHLLGIYIVYGRMHAHFGCIPLCVYIHTHTLYVCMYVYIYTRTHTHTCTITHRYTGMYRPSYSAYTLMFDRSMSVISTLSCQSAQHLDALQTHHTRVQSRSHTYAVPHTQLTH